MEVVEELTEILLQLQDFLVGREEAEDLGNQLAVDQVLAHQAKAIQEELVLEEFHMVLEEVEVQIQQDQMALLVLEEPVEMEYHLVFQVPL